jgi:light-regulated signal transduction histidine kinase (bacteriophytochrome)
MVMSLLGALALALLVTWLVARSITRPLVDLAREATDMAHRHLPESVRSVLATPVDEDVAVPPLEPIEVRSRDEVVDLAAALATIQDVALRVATEQAGLRRNLADAWLNIGRRNQNLLERQIGFLTERETAELDSGSLAALFHLDHLATRMRRNAESLLVLAGVGTPRQHRNPVPISDVVRAALGEVEDFRRVSPAHLGPVAIAGATAADLSHMLAELIENALTFSPTDTAVEIRGGSVRDNYRLAIIDQGAGMNAETLRQANRRLASTETFTLAPSRHLGHYVAGRLAARHAVSVSVHRLTGGGLTAVVDLPPDLLATIPNPNGRR